LRAAAEEYGPERRIILLHGPVGSAKSTIVRAMKKGIEAYSRTTPVASTRLSGCFPKPCATSAAGRTSSPRPMHEEPLKLIPRGVARERIRGARTARATAFVQRIRGDLDPASRLHLPRADAPLPRRLVAVMEHIRVKRPVLSEEDRVGIGTFQPKDEKNQDSTELTGDINYRRIAEYGSDTDPRAFNFDGEFNVANRGLIEFVEVLKLDVAFLYDLLGATQEQKIKPKKFAQTDIDEVIIGHTNEAEYNRLLENKFMEALRDRTVKIDIPYITKLQEEIRIYAKDYNAARVRGRFIAPHTLETAAMWSILTRLEEPKKHQLSLLQKLKLYDGKTMPGFTQDSVKELRKEAQREGMEGISPRYVQDKIANCLVSDRGQLTINPFMVLNELESGLRSHSLLTNEDQRKRYTELLAVVKQEYEDIVKNEVQRAISADADAIARLCANYIDNVKAYTQREKVKNVYTGQDEEPDERLMRSIETKIDIPESRKDDFRREIMNYIGALAIEGKLFDYRANERLYKALELKLFEDQKDSIKLTSLVSQVVDREAQAKIDVVKQRLIRNFGYDEVSATDVLTYVASIFARGEMKKA
jgi:serine protein kinase